MSSQPRREAYFLSRGSQDPSRVEKQWDTCRRSIENERPGPVGCRVLNSVLAFASNAQSERNPRAREALNMLLLPPMKDDGDPLKAITFFQTVCARPGAVPSASLI